MRVEGKPELMNNSNTGRFVVQDATKLVGQLIESRLSNFSCSFSSLAEPIPAFFSTDVIKNTHKKTKSMPKNTFSL